MRLSIALLTIVATAAGSTEASACCLTDWLFGRHHARYAAGYAPVAATPYAANYAPVPVTTPITMAPAQSTSVLRPAWNAAPVLSSGVYQVQRPVYNNPSVYTGLPVSGTAQTVYRAPLTTVLRGTGTGSSYMGAGNQYPTTYPTYASGYAAAQVNPASPGLPLQVTTPSGAPATALPTTQVAPIYPVAQPRPGGLARFFGSLFGTNYRSAYYRAPVTYYRPATTIDPVSGTTVTVQQPCTAYTQTLQRTPYSNLQLGQSTTVLPTTSYGTSGIGQVGGLSTSGQYVTPIPSTVAPAAGGAIGQTTYAPNVAPLTGAPPAQAAPLGNGDRAPVDQPRLEQRPPQENGGSNGSGVEKQKSYWELQDAANSTAMIHPAQRRPVTRRDPVSLDRGNAPMAEPIPAPEDYSSPFRTRRITPTPAPATDTFEAPPLPERSLDRGDATSTSGRTITPVREAALIRHPVTTYVAPANRPAAPIKRDTTWIPIQP